MKNTLLYLFSIATLFLNGQSVGGFIRFDGNPINPGVSDGDHIDVPDDPSLDFNSTDFSLEFWINPQFDFTGGATGIEGIITKKTSGSSASKGYAVYWESTATQKRIKFNLGDGNQRTLSTNNFPDINTTGWMHIAAVFNKSSKDSAFLYLDGQLVDKTSVSTITDMSNSYDLQLMTFSTSSQNAGGGGLDDIRIWNKALTQEEIKMLRLEPIEQNGSLVRGVLSLRNIPGLSWSDLLLYFNCDALSGTTLLDQSGNGNHGTFYNGNAAGGGPVRIPYSFAAQRPVFQSQLPGGIWSNSISWDVNTVPDDPRSIVFIRDADITIVNNGLNPYNVGDLIINSGRNLLANSGSVLNIHGDFEVDGTFDPQFGSIDLTGSGKQAIRELGTLRFNDLEINKTGEASLISNAELKGVLTLMDGQLLTGDDFVLIDNPGNPFSSFGFDCSGWKWLCFW